MLLTTLEQVCDVAVSFNPTSFVKNTYKRQMPLSPKG